MTNNNDKNSLKGANKAKGENPRTPGGAFPVTTPHLLYRDWQALKVDGRSFYAKRKKEVIGKLLDHFKPPVPGPAEILANITAANLLLALRMEGMLHAGTLAPSAFQDYLRLTSSNSANLVRLWSMARDSSPQEDNFPLLHEYLKMSDKEKELLKAKESGQLVVIEPSSKPADVSQALTSSSEDEN